MLRAKMPLIDRYNQARRRVAHRYNAGLSGLDLLTPLEDGIGLHVYHQYTLLSAKRDAIMAKLTERQIASAIYYPIPLHRQQCFADKGYRGADSVPVAEQLSAEVLSIPIFPELTEEQRQWVADSLAAFAAGKTE